MNDHSLDDALRPYKPRRCCECRNRPRYTLTDNGPAWLCQCGAFARVRPTRQESGRTAFPETHALRVRAMASLSALADALSKERGLPTHKGRSMAYRMAGAVLKSRVEFRTMNAAQAQKVIDAFGEPE